jgi:hypothetical protein
MLPDDMRKLAEQVRQLHDLREKAKETKIANMLRGAAALEHLKRKVRPS